MPQRPLCEEACPYITTQIPQPEILAPAIDVGVPCGSINILYLWRRFRARNCPGPLPLAGDNQVIYCSTVQRGILPDGGRASRLVARELTPQQMIEGRNPERWRTLYQEQKDERRAWYEGCIEELRADTYTAEEIAHVRATSLDEIAGQLGVNILDPHKMTRLRNDSEFQQRVKKYDRYMRLSAIVESADEIEALMWQLGPQTTEAQAISTAVANHDEAIRQAASLLLENELKGNS